MIKVYCKFVPIDNFQRQNCSSKCLEGNREQFRNWCILQDFSAPLAMALCSMRCISETAHRFVWLVCLTAALNGVNWGDFILFYSINAKWAPGVRVPLRELCLLLCFISIYIAHGIAPLRCYSVGWRDRCGCSDFSGCWRNAFESRANSAKRRPLWWAIN